MKKVLIGSVAAGCQFIDFRKAKDIDYLVDGDLPKEPGVEYHNANVGLGVRRIFDESTNIASPEHLYTLKVSHCFWDKEHWPKTMNDILFFQTKKIAFDDELFQILYKDWELYHGKKRAYLKKENNDFFEQDAVQRTYVHDDIHCAIAYYDRPMYERIKKDVNLAAVDKGLFEQLPFEEQLKVCREEIYVTALERFIIPKDYRISTLTAYRGACKLLLTSMTKGWFPKFVALNWLHLNRPDSHNFVAKFKSWSSANENRIA